ncbi:MAG: hypothetical protein ACQCN6_06650 [Candidatus Bathyarchaeia archaeon]
MHFGKITFTALMLAVAAYVLVPTFDELIIHPTFALFLAGTLNIPYSSAIFLSIVIYRVLGVSCFILALAVGGKPAFYALKDKISRNPLPKNALSQLFANRIRRRRRQFTGR